MFSNKIIGAKNALISKIHFTFKFTENRFKIFENINGTKKLTELMINIFKIHKRSKKYSRFLSDKNERINCIHLQLYCFHCTLKSNTSFHMFLIKNDFLSIKSFNCNV